MFLAVLILLSLVVAILLNAKIFLLAFAAAYFVAFYLCRPAIFLVLIILIYQVRISFNTLISFPFYRLQLNTLMRWTIMRKNWEVS